MKKLKLDHDDLRVETFAPAEPVQTRGTVNAQGGPDTGLTSICATGGATDCPGQTECADFTWGYTCGDTACTDAGCTACGAIC